MSQPCKAHQRYSCYDSRCTQDNAGQISVTTSGDLAMGIGSGLAIDLETGSLGVNVGGITVDFDSGSSSDSGSSFDSGF